MKQKIFKKGVRKIKKELFIPRKATKEHICSICKETIFKKEKYIFFAPEEIDKKDMHLHYSCAFKYFKKGYKDDNKTISK